ncbi:MAG: SMP-30/gluconolactonase/LRE family protein [Anaerolineae bacterium]
MLKRAVLMLGIVLLSMGLVWAQESTPEAAEMQGALPEQVIVEYEGLFPEGVAWDSVNGRWLVSSTSEGTVFAVDDDGTPTPFIEDARIPSSMGLEVDEANNRLLVAATDMEREGYLGIYDLTSGENLAWVDFAPLLPTDPEHFVNDVAVDSAGNAYVTDSYAGVIYVVNPGGAASVFLSDESFSTQFALNGIAYHAPSNALIAVRLPELIKIPVDNPQNFTTIMLSQPLPGLDGIVFLDDSTLAVVNNAPPSVYRVESSDNFETATITGMFSPGNVFPTTIAERSGEGYVLHAQLNREESTTSTFPIERVIFSDSTGMMADPMAEVTPDATEES